MATPTEADAPPRRANQRLPCRNNGDHAAAKRLFQIGRKKFDEADYQGSALSFLEAYRVSCKALLLFNAARAYQLMGDREAAENALRTGLDHAESDDQRQQFERELRRLETR